ncbi:MAG TPA: hypothetical protein VEL76_03620, partial [Gemmataceae bacterium]|nr:hypothetical protein [Gemmataceae bacterium]
MLLRFPSLAATLVLALVAMAPRASAGGKISNNERDARAALKEASALSEQAKTLIGDRCRWEVTLVKASETLKRAEILLANAPKADPALKRQLTKLAAAIAEQERDRRLLEQLEAIRLQTSARKDGQARPQYAAAFREYGLPLEELDAAKAAARLREQPSPVREAVLAALDHLALLLDDKAGKRLRDVLAAADPDPWRTRLREALGKRDQASLKKLASDLDLTQQTPAAVILLADGLVATGATSEAVAVLRKAHQLWPADFWLNHRLAQ